MSRIYLNKLDKSKCLKIIGLMVKLIIAVSSDKGHFMGSTFVDLVCVCLCVLHLL